MIVSRHMTTDDLPALLSSINRDEYHKDDEDPLAFWLESHTITNVYEDEDGPVLFLRGKIVGTSGMRLDIQFLKNEDAKRNVKCMLIGLPLLEKEAKTNGFQFFVFESKSPLLKRFCIKRLGFTEFIDNWLSKVYNENS